MFFAFFQGTPLYMAPEVIGGTSYDQKADCWSIGCVIYEMLMTRPPFKSSTIMDLVRMQKEANIIWPEHVSDDCRLFLMVSAILLKVEHLH